MALSWNNEDNRIKDLTGYSSIQEILNAASSGDITALEAQKLIGSLDYGMGPIGTSFAKFFGSKMYMSSQQEKFLNDLMANQATENSYNFQREQQQTAVLDLANQYQQLGLSPSNVVSAGSNIAGAAPVASYSKENISQQIFNNQYGLAKSLISMAGSMASSGIYGAAINAVKHSAAKMSEQVAHSANNIDYKRLIYEAALKSSIDNRNNGY